MKKALIIIFLLLSTSQTYSKEKEANITAAFDAITWFKGRLYATAETTGGSANEWEILENKAIEKIKIAAKKYPNSLIYKNKNGLTPLIYASILGYDFMVDTLLQYQNVKNTQQHKSNSGLTALNYAIMASRQSVFACNPQIMTNIYALIPRLVTLPYYEANKPYANLLISLEYAKHPEADNITLQYMLKHCKNPTRIYAKKLKNADDLQAELIRLGRETIKIFSKQQKQRTKN